LGETKAAVNPASEGMRGPKASQKAGGLLPPSHGESVGGMRSL